MSAFLIGVFWNAFACLLILQCLNFFRAFLKWSVFTGSRPPVVSEGTPGFLAKQSFLPSRSYSRPRQRVILLQVVFIFWRVLEAVSLYWLVSARGLRRDPGIYSEIVFSLTCSCWRPCQRVICFYFFIREFFIGSPSLVIRYVAVIHFWQSVFTGWFFSFLLFLLERKSRAKSSRTPPSLRGRVRAAAQRSASACLEGPLC